MSDIVLFGTGQFAEVAKAYLDWEGSHNVAAFAVHRDFLIEDSKDGLPITPWEGLEQNFPHEQVKLFCPFSYTGLNKIRQSLFEDGLARGYDFISFIHPKAHYYDTPVGRNCFILEANVIQPHVEIGDNCILWSGNHIGHHTGIGAHTFIASHAVVSGSVDVGERCFIGVNATIRDNVTIGAETVIGAGALVNGDVPEASVIPGPKSAISRVKSHQLKRI